MDSAFKTLVDFLVDLMVVREAMKREYELWESVAEQLPLERLK